MSSDGAPGARHARWLRVEEIFLRVADLPPAERAVVLDAECGDDEALRTEVESLVAEHGSDPDFLEGLPPWLADTGTGSGPGEAGGEPEPDRIGPYRVLRRLGRGGMGTVYLAERSAADFTQEVAVKVVRRGLDSEDVLARFRAERRILARLTHPNIARLLDVGALEDGRPYLVMEHVEGEPLRAYCERRSLDVEERIRLAEAVCGALDHAHRRLVVHRDLKPANILVSDEGVPKLLDFGIAKILDPDAGGLRGFTRVGQRVLTPAYAAPEQVRGGAVTTAVDVYALGILLYELLTDCHPVAAALGRRQGEPSRAEVERAVLEADPPRPSQVVSAQARGSGGGRIDRDLDHIVLKALRKEPEARYGSVAALADDLRRHRRGFPVEARASTVPYRIGRFARRNPRLVGVAAAGLTVLLVSTGVVAYQSSRLRAESARVARERDKALEVRGFLLESFGGTGPDQAAGEPVAARTLLDNRAARLEGDFADDPEMRAEMLMVLAEAYDRLGLYEEAEPRARRALDLRREHFGPAHADLVSALDLLGWILHERGRPDEAEPLLREAVRMGRAVFPGEGSPRLARALNDLGVAREVAGDWDEAGALYRESLAMRRRLGEGDTRGTAITRSNLAVVLYRRGDLEAAVATAEDALAHFRQAFGPDHHRTLVVQNNLAAMRAQQGDHAGAEAEHRDIVERQRRRLGPDHSEVAHSLSMLANELLAQDRPGEAEALLAEALAIQRSSLGPEHPDVAPTLRVLGAASLAAGRPDEALGPLDEALGIVRSVRGPEHPEAAVILGYIAEAHRVAGRLEPAARAAAEAYRLGRERYGPGNLEVADRGVTLARIRLAQGDSSTVAALADQVADDLARAGADPDHSLAGWVDWLREQIGVAAPEGGRPRNRSR